MLPKNCAYCRKLFVPRLMGLGYTFCQTCTELCEASYHKIRGYMQINPKATPAQVAVNLSLPNVFVQHLFRLGRFAPDLSTRNSLSKRKYCTLCQKLLDSHEEVYCRPCNKMVDQRMHVRYNKVSTSVARPVVSSEKVQRGTKSPFTLG